MRENLQADTENGDEHQNGQCETVAKDDATLNGENIGDDVTEENRGKGQKDVDKVQMENDRCLWKLRMKVIDTGDVDRVRQEKTDATAEQSEVDEMVIVRGR